MITVLAGGTGSAKLVRGLASLTDELVVISNVGDNFWLHGLYICPDIDTILYALSGNLDVARGWGVRDESFHFLEYVKKYGAPAWFSIGDKDLAMHVTRTQMIRQGKTLSEITDYVRQKLAVKVIIIPATDDPVSTLVSTNKGRMHLQEFWVREKARPKVDDIQFEGAAEAIPNASVMEAIRKADTIIIAPGNPVSSIGPTLAINGLREELARKRKRVIAVSPIIGKKAFSGPALKYMKAAGIPASPVGVAKYFKECIGNFVVDKSDHDLADEIRKLGIEVFETDIMMKDKRGEIRLARYVVNRLDAP